MDKRTAGQVQAFMDETRGRPLSAADRLPALPEGE